MRFLHRLWFFAWVLVAPSLCLPSTASDQGDLVRVLSGVKGLRVVQFEKMQSRYSETLCVELIRTQSGRKVGFVCRTRDRHFVEDMGIASLNALPQGALPAVSPGSGFVVATPMAQYNTEQLAGVAAPVAAAVVDCDLQGLNVYRATASCHVAILETNSPEVVYSNLLVENHVAKRKEMTKDQIVAIWKRLTAP